MRFLNLIKISLTYNSAKMSKGLKIWSGQDILLFWLEQEW